ncbi:hypothetical protein [Poseidonibacter ostreae]|uniref:Uncharacterized protein n=1 Tax=Poseidonibacter ostreae TaxID=2654171 RepID=A0A6L4WP22_9BACT|nr:hypothetical protein [Poseidonibacter ostreae]KAB7885220.1 hypothetical protein GBG19_14510 [Poseidonibacter ostreae]KAB7886566.1 hypothetical protein GA417_05355 [Poseidonibacter ostreae]KAB7892431.1 hypothetical protein GBG18_03090 [Poseidonibacter ostreae]MAC83408.1 hypothetical protein [Arcobacter sp.]
MSLDMLIPFGILLALVVYLIFTRSKFEKEVVEVYEKKFDEWKEFNTTTTKEVEPAKVLVGLVYKTGYKVSVELLDESAKAQLEKGKFEISEIKDK